MFAQISKKSFDWENDCLLRWSLERNWSFGIENQNRIINRRMGKWKANQELSRFSRQLKEADRKKMFKTKTSDFRFLKSCRE